MAVGSNIKRGMAGGTPKSQKNQGRAGVKTKKHLFYGSFINKSPKHQQFKKGPAMYDKAL
jgi:hypothetical protein